MATLSLFLSITRVSTTLHRPLASQSVELEALSSTNRPKMLQFTTRTIRKCLWWSHNFRLEMLQIMDTLSVGIMPDHLLTPALLFVICPLQTFKSQETLSTARLTDKPPLRCMARMELREQVRAPLPIRLGAIRAMLVPNLEAPLIRPKNRTRRPL